MTKVSLMLSAIGSVMLPLAVPAVAAPVEPAVANAQGDSVPSSKARQGQRICVVSEFTGSRISRKICKTRADWIVQQGIDPLAAR